MPAMASAVCFTEILSIICEDRTSPSCPYCSLPCMGTEISVTSVDSHLPAPLFASVEVALFSFGELGGRNWSGVAQSCCFLPLLKGDAHPVRLCSLLPWAVVLPRLSSPTRLCAASELNQGSCCCHDRTHTGRDIGREVAFRAVDSWHRTQSQMSMRDRDRDGSRKKSRRACFFFFEEILLPKCLLLRGFTD